MVLAFWNVAKADRVSWLLNRMTLLVFEPRNFFFLNYHRYSGTGAILYERCDTEYFDEKPSSLTAAENTPPKRRFAAHLLFSAQNKEAAQKPPPALCLVFIRQERFHSVLKGIVNIERRSVGNGGVNHGGIDLCRCFI